MDDSSLKSLAKPKAMVYGIGNIGRCIASYMTKLGYGVTTVDIIDANFNDHPYKHYKIVEPQSIIPHGNCWPIPLEEPDIVISALPYFENYRLATYCIDHGYRYCDLGGSIAVSNSIWGYAEDKATMPVFTDLGLAPGWVNIVAEEVYRQLPLKKANPGVVINMFCGGFSQEPESLDNVLEYGPTWSIDGLINEYMDDCDVIEDYVTVKKPSMTGRQEVYVENQELEAFFTSGGMAHSRETMVDKSVKSCAYRTLRMPGHSERMKILFAVDDTGDAARKVLNSLEPCTEDMVFFRVEGHESTHQFRNFCIFEEAILKKEDDEFSAMASATSAACCSVADLMGQGLMDDLTHYKRKHRLTYDQVNYHMFMRNMKKLVDVGMRHDDNGY